MSGEYKDMSGWYITPPDLLNAIPKERADLIEFRNEELTFVPPYFYRTEVEAETVLRKLLTEEEKAADSLLAKYPEARDTARKSLEIAVAGLRLLNRKQ